MSASSVGCPLEDEAKTGADPASSTAEDGTNGSANPDNTGSGGGGGNSGGNGSETGSTSAGGSDNPGSTGEGSDESDAGADPAVPPDMGADGGTGTEGDAGTGTGGELDAAAAIDAGAEPGVDAGMPDPVDAGPVVDPGPPVVVPDLGDATLADADRATLIFNLMQTENYVDGWFPMLQPSGAQRALIIAPSHGNQVRVRQNPVAKQAIDAWVAAGMPLPLQMPNGSVIVKDMYKLDTVTGLYSYNGGVAMAKIAVLDSTAYEGKWFYVRISATNVPSRGTTCTNCHNGRGAKTVWPANPNVMGDPGGRVDAIVPYDYLFIPFCADPKTTECEAPHG